MSEVFLAMFGVFLATFGVCLAMFGMFLFMCACFYLGVPPHPRVFCAPPSHDHLQYEGQQVKRFSHKSMLKCRQECKGKGRG